MLDRNRERRWLEAHLAEPTPQLLVVYGRRRVGKTTLVTEVLDGLEQPSVYHLCSQRGIAYDATRFGQVLADTFDDVAPAVENFEDAFQYLTSRVDGPFVIALDEFPYLVDADEAVLGSFQRIVDEVLDGTEISLILLGSSIAMMEEGVLSYESPLYGRRTGQWRLEPMHLGQVRCFFPDAGAIELMRIYSVLGGVPAYLDQVDPNAPLSDNITEHILTKGSYLYEEPEFLLRQELRDPTTYMAILEAVASGATRVTEIANEIGRDASQLSRYLQNLQRLGLIDRDTPVTDPDGRGVYRITDHFLRFWFRFVAPNRSSLEQGRTAPVMAAIEADLPRHVSWAFEDVCRQTVTMAGFPGSWSRVGRWWYQEQEVDIAAVDDSTATLLLGECKWHRDPVDASVLDALTAVAPDVRWRGQDRTVRYAVFSRSGFTDEFAQTAAQRDDVDLYTPRQVLAVFEDGPTESVD